MTYLYSEYLAHHGVKGQKWGVRRYQNEDGTLTPEGRAYYAQIYGDSARATKEVINRAEAKRDAKKAKIAQKYERKIQEQDRAAKELRRAAMEITPRRDFYEGVAKDTEARRDALKAEMNRKTSKIDQKHEKKYKRQYQAYGELMAAYKSVTLNDIKKKRA